MTFLKSQHGLKLSFCFFTACYRSGDERITWLSSFYYHLQVSQKSKLNPLWLSSVLGGLELYGTRLFHSVIPVNATWAGLSLLELLQLRASDCYHLWHQIRLNKFLSDRFKVSWDPGKHCPKGLKMNWSSSSQQEVSKKRQCIKSGSMCYLINLSATWTLQVHEIKQTIFPPILIWIMIFALQMD